MTQRTLSPTRSTPTLKALFVTLNSRELSDPTLSSDTLRHSFDKHSRHTQSTHTATHTVYTHSLERLTRTICLCHTGVAEKGEVEQPIVRGLWG